MKNYRKIPGLHVIGDLYDCSCNIKLLTNKHLLSSACKRIVEFNNLTIVDSVFYDFGENQGITGAIILAESHVTIHTWPEERYVTLDVFACNYNKNNRQNTVNVFYNIAKILQYNSKKSKVQLIDRY